ncbi:MAG: hypothetical protein HYR85_13405 [Planctomycetes bacterium]|nr:hypothetical protein [Planctomycetota bacterium]MBI3846185.1 hypothetical protein [Planctomycetota bacterium]
MLRFACDPDRVFLVILHAAIEVARDEIHPYPLGCKPAASEEHELQENYAAGFPVLAEAFSRAEIVPLLDRLLAASRDAGALYQITDWCWLVLHDCLENLIYVHNDVVSDHDDGLNEVGPYRIGRIDFDAILDAYFWDTDFLMGRPLVDMSEEAREHMGVSPETFGIAAGLKPHPEELRITPVEWESPDRKPFKLKGPAEGRIPCYPPLAD